MGMGATNTYGRLLASVGLGQATQLEFQECMDVSNAGVLLALPCLLAVGLLKHTEKNFEIPPGYYDLSSLFLLLAFMALARVKDPESLRYCAPGEWGKLLGLDRIPEVKTLRQKIKILSEQGQVKQWGGELSQDWMSSNPETAGIFYVDGHVRVYHGHQTKLPRHYVARERLSLRATTDYWVNAMDSQPFFLVTKAVDPGLIKVLEEDIVVRLEKEVPNQPDEATLSQNPLLHRFTIVFDREGYSPDFFLRMKKKRIACLSYHKYPGEDWREEEFYTHEVKLNSGATIKMDLAERGVQLSNKLWVREIRKRSQKGHQTSVLSTDYSSGLLPVALAMFARWSQENFFKYMREHYNLDRLIDYQTEAIPETVQVVNPDYRKLDSQIRSKTQQLSRSLAKFGAVTLTEEINEENINDYQTKKSDLKEETSNLQSEIDQLKEKRKGTKKHITVSQLPEEERFNRLSTQSKHLIDTIKMIAYRAETSMSYILKEKMSRPDESRRLLRSIYKLEADLLPDKEKRTLTVRLHHLANKSEDEAMVHLCQQINETKTIFPGTDLVMNFELL